jgi:hypothetical protein
MKVDLTGLSNTMLELWQKRGAIQHNLKGSFNDITERGELTQEDQG